MKRSNVIKTSWSRVRSSLICILTIIMSVCFAAASIITIINATMSPLDKIKVRLMRQIEYYGWDPYSAKMSIDEFYALMELFDEGKLPLKKTTALTSGGEEDGVAEDGENGGVENSYLIIPRERFLLAGLPGELASEDMITDNSGTEQEVLDQPLVYEYNKNYEPYDPNTNEAYKVGENEGEYILNGVTYKLNDDGRLYDVTATVYTYQYAFESKNKVIYVMNNDGDDENGEAYQNEGFVVYDTAGNRVSLTEDLDEMQLTSLSTGAVYIVDGGGIFEYDAETETTGNGFDEETGEYFVINKQIYVWGNNALYIPGVANAAICNAIKALSYRYPEGYGLSNSGYMRPPKDWEGVKVEDAGDVQTVLVKKGINDGRYDISGDVDQSVFQGDPKENGDYEHGILYNGYYIKQITIDGANVNILGIIRVPETGRLVYYYLSAEEQDWQVSTTTLHDEDKFLIEYTPNEYKVDYQVLMAENYTDGMDLTKVDESKLVSGTVPNNVVMYGSNTATTLSWVDSIFGTTATRPARTTGGAYSFDVLVPYGYEVQIFISVDRNISGTYKDSSGKDIPDIAKEPNATGAIPYVFHVDIDHTDSREKVEQTWLNGYRDYLINNGIIGSAADFEYERTDEDGRYVYKWTGDSTNADVHNGVFEIMAERINDIQMHNSGRNSPESGYPLGMYPDYSVGSKFNVLPNEKTGPEMLTLNDTFYNHLVKANRLITAVLTKHGEPTFDVSKILQESNGAVERGASANVDWAFDSTDYYGLDDDGNSLDLYDADYLFHAARGNADVNMSGDPLNGHSSSYPNVYNINNNWGWPSETNAGNFKNAPQDMRYDDKTGTYYYTWLFQTNGGGFTLDAFEVNGISLQIPFFPKYNWQDSYENGVKYDEKHPYFTETTLQDGAVVTLEFLLGWKATNYQRHYRITVKGARSNVVVTGLNLITGTGAAEFVTYNLTGVYSDLGGASSKQHAIEFYNNNGSVWTRERESNVVVSDTDGLKDVGDDAYYGANLRFKIADGYGSPYYMYTDTSGKVINNETSLSGVDADGFPDPTTARDVVNFSEVKAEIEGFQNGTVPERTLTDSNNKILSQYIYYDDISVDGYYYFHITRPNDTNNKTPKICLLTVVAKTVKYTVRYTSSYDSTNSQAFNSQNAFYGYIQGEQGGLTQMQYGQKAPNDKVFELDADSMPEFIHDRVNTCDLINMIDPDKLEGWWKILHQYDDNGGAFYDMIYNTKASIASNTYGTIRPKDINNAYTFVAWVLVDENFAPYTGENGDYIYFSSGIIDLNVYADYAVKHSAFGTDDVDLKVFRLMPVWKANNNPYSYSVVLNWVDAKGTLNQIEFSDWDDVVTEAQDGEQLFVFLNKDSIPLQNWIASHPTYTFWDAVNNATTRFKTNEDGSLKLDENGNPERDREANTQILKDELETYLQRAYNPEEYPEDALILQALVNRDYTGFNENGIQTEAGHWEKSTTGSDIVDPYYGKIVHVDYVYVDGGNGVDDFDRLDGNIFRVNENGGTISIWMYETKGGLIFKKNVEVEPFIGDDEFYFSIVNNWVGEEKKDENGNVIETPTVRLGTVDDPVSYKAYPLTVYNEEKGTWGFYDKSGNFTAATDEDSWLVTFVEGEIISIAQYGEVLTELDEYGNEVNVTYFTLVDEQGIALYVPNGNYTIVEVGSKSGGSYQADVSYTDDSGNEISGSVELPTGKDENGNDVELWMKGTNKKYIHLEDGEKFDEGRYAGVSQIPVTVIFKTGEKELIQTLTFYNKTNSLSVKMTLHQNVYDKYPTNGTQTAKDNWDVTYNSDYDFSVVFALPEGQTPLVQGVTGYARDRAVTDVYYFKMNVYSDLDSDEKKFVRTEDVSFVKYNPDYDEIDNPTPDRNPWEIETDDYENLWIGKFTLQPGEQGALVMQVMTGNVNYWVDEPGKTEENNGKLWNDLTPTWKTSKYGTANVGMENSVWVENYYGEPTPSDFGYLKITVEGGKPTESFLFRITGFADDGLNSADIIVSVKGGSSTYVYILYGTYTVEEIGWAWRYNVTSAIKTTVGTPHTEYDDAQEITFEASPGKGWLGGESSIDKWLS